jgi:hypothetical protein
VLSTDLVGPSSLGVMNRGQLFTLWFDGFVSGRDKLIVSIGLEVSISDSAESINITYVKDDGSKSGQILMLNDPGYHVITVPVRNERGEATGVLFDRISLGIKILTNLTDTSHVFHSRGVKRLSLNYTKAQLIRRAYRFLVQSGSGESAAEVRRSLEEVFEKQSLVEFAFRDPVSDSGENRFVTPVSLRSEEVTGMEERGKFRIVVTEV